MSVKAMWAAYVELLVLGPDKWERRISLGQDVLCGLRDSISAELNLPLRDVQECAEEQATIIKMLRAEPNWLPPDRSNDPVIKAMSANKPSDEEIDREMMRMFRLCFTEEEPGPSYAAKLMLRCIAKDTLERRKS